MRTRDIRYQLTCQSLDRRYAWCCFHDGDDDNHCGYGATPEEALADLERLDQERAELVAMDSDGFNEQAGGY